MTDSDQMRRSSLAAERTWLAWWRTALGAIAGALAVGRFAPDLLHGAAGRSLLSDAATPALDSGCWSRAPDGSVISRPPSKAIRIVRSDPGLVTVFTSGGVLLAVATIVLVVAQS